MVVVTSSSLDKRNVYILQGLAEVVDVRAARARQLLYLWRVRWHRDGGAEAKVLARTDGFLRAARGTHAQTGVGVEVAFAKRIVHLELLRQQPTNEGNGAGVYRAVDGRLQGRRRRTDAVRGPGDAHLIRFVLYD